MKVKTFKGGVHPAEYKELSNQCPITSAFPASKTVTIPVTMGGAPNTPCVKVGDTVAKGQVIAEGQGFMNCPVHASIAGRVKKIADCVVTGSQEVPCIIIEADGTDNCMFMEAADPFVLETPQILERIRQAGIVGQGGASFPAHVKFNPPADKKIEFVLVNAAECEPFLTCDERVMQETPQRLIDGLAIILHLFKDAKGIIALEDNKSYIKPILENEIADKNYSDKMSVQLVKTKYPQGAEKFIVKVCTDREIPSGKLPADAGCVISNAGTLCAVSDAFRKGMPVIERCFTVSGGAVEQPWNLKVPVGTIVNDLIPDTFNIKPDACVKIISGGPMMGFTMADALFPVVKGTSGVTFLTKEEAVLDEEDPCIGCGICVRSCAMKLTPVMMLREIKSGNYEKAKAYGLMDCIECGCCAFMCPAHIKLIQRIRLGKGVIRQKMAEERLKASMLKEKELKEAK